MRPELLVLALLVMMAGCTEQGVAREVDAGPLPTGQNEDAGTGDGGVARSQKGNLRFKGPERLAADLSVALQLPADGLCKELGRYSCTETVHTVALGGVDPYGHSVYESPTVTGATTPIAIERIVLSACTARVTNDLTTPGSAVVFKNLPLTSGRLADPAGAEVSRVITELARRAWLRDPTATEVAALVQLARDIETTGSSEPARAWMQAACLAVFSSAEAVFY